MIAAKIDNAVARLRELGGQVSPEHWTLIRAAAAELTDAADSARHLEAVTLPITEPVTATLNQ